MSETTMRAALHNLGPDVARTALELLSVTGHVSDETMRRTITLARELSALRAAEIAGDLQRG